MRPAASLRPRHRPLKLCTHKILDAALFQNKSICCRNGRHDGVWRGRRHHGHRPRCSGRALHPGRSPRLYRLQPERLGRDRGRRIHPDERQARGLPRRVRAGRRHRGAPVAITLQTAVPIAQLLDCLEPGWRDRFSPADMIKVADTPNAFPPLQGNGSARPLATPLGYTFTFSGTGWKPRASRAASSTSTREIVSSSTVIAWCGTTVGRDPGRPPCGRRHELGDHARASTGPPPASSPPPAWRGAVPGQAWHPRWLGWMWQERPVGLRPDRQSAPGISVQVKTRGMVA